MSCRSRVLAALGLALALIGAASGWVSAAAAAPAPVPGLDPIDSVTVVSVGFTVGPTGEELSVTADSSSPLTAMTAHLYDTGTGTDTLDPVMQQSASGPQPGNSTWTAPVTAGTAAGDLPLGTYNVTVDVTFADGTVIQGTTAGAAAFQDTPAVTLTVNPVLSHNNQDPVVSGTVTVLAPGANIGTPYAGEPVTLVASGQQDVTRDTDGSGDYTFTLASPQPGETLYVEVPGSMAVAAAQSSTVKLTTQSDQVRMSAALSASTVTYGGKVTVKGTVTYAPGVGGFVPLDGQAVRIYAGTGSGSPVATAVTNGKGSFSAALPKEATSVRWVLRASGPYLNTATDTLPMKVNLPTVITGFMATLNQEWQVGFHGCLGLAAGVPGYVPSLAGLTIQYATRPGGPWHTLGAPVTTQKSFVCGNDGRTFNGTLPAQVNYAYYRAVYAGGTDRTGTGYLPSASRTSLAWKYKDLIASFTVSSRTVNEGGKLTISGRLQYYYGKWRNYPGQPIEIIYRAQGSDSWYFIPIVWTNSAGQFSATVIPQASATWSAEYLGNPMHLDAGAPMVFVRVKT